ncbi:SAM-dependent methyltransferase, partial [Pseudomonas aeruginosa]
RGDSLDINWLKDSESLNANELPAPEVLAGEAMAELTGALRELDQLMQALGAGDEAEQEKRMLAKVMGLAVAQEVGD